MNCAIPFSFAHGGAQVQIEQTSAALKSQGVDVENLRWWDEAQHGDIVHHFGILPAPTIRLAQKRGMRVITTILLSQTCNRGSFQLWLRKVQVFAASRVPPLQTTNYASCRACDHIIVGLEAEKRIVTKIYGVSENKVSTLPLGTPAAFLARDPFVGKKDYLITVGTIAPVKRSVELALLARKAQVPILFVGKPFDPSDSYWSHFQVLIDHKWIRYHPHISSEAELISLYRAARGFVLMSQFENWSLAAHEAAACGLPLLLRNLPWSRERFGNQASYFPRFGTIASNTRALKSFYEEAESSPSPRIKLCSWQESAEKLRQVYSTTLARAV